MKNTESIKIKKLLDALNKAETQIMKDNGKIAVEFFQQNFYDKGFTDKNFKAWKKAKDPDADPARLLYRTGKLKNSIKIYKADAKSVSVVYGTPYGRFINEGTVNMVRRKFLGKSATLTKLIKENVKKSLNKLFGKKK